MFGAHVFVLKLAHLLHGHVKQIVQPVRYVNLSDCTRTGNLWDFLDLLVQAVAHQTNIGSQLFQDCRGHAFGVLKHGLEQMFDLNLLMISLGGHLLGLCHSLLSFECKFI